MKKRLSLDLPSRTRSVRDRLCCRIAVALKTSGADSACGSEQHVIVSGAPITFGEFAGIQSSVELRGKGLFSVARHFMNPLLARSNLL